MHGGSIGQGSSQCGQANQVFGGFGRSAAKFKASFPVVIGQEVQRRQSDGCGEVGVQLVLRLKSIHSKPSLVFYGPGILTFLRLTKILGLFL